MTKPMKPLTHEERLALINKPFPTFTIVSGHSWHGADLQRARAPQKVEDDLWLEWVEGLIYGQQEEE